MNMKGKKPFYIKTRYKTKGLDLFKHTMEQDRNNWEGKSKDLN